MQTPQPSRRVFPYKILLASLVFFGVLLVQDTTAQTISEPTTLDGDVYILSSCEIVIHDSIIMSDLLQTGILASTHAPTVCQLNPLPCPGIADTTLRHYKRYRFYNIRGSLSSQCVTVRVQATGCSGNLVSAAYLPSFNHQELCSAYLGDIGEPVITSASYGFSVPRGTYLEIVVSEVSPDSGCSDYTLSIEPQYDCFAPTPTPSITKTPTGTATQTSTSTPTSTPTPLPSSTPTNTSTGTITLTSIPTNTTTTTPTTTPTNTLSVTLIPTSTLSVTLTPTTGPSSTSTLPITTPSATACAITFTDVEPGSTFYAYIPCLACLGIVSGYPDGTYRPGNSVTRGQASKIIANSAGWVDTIPPGQQTFNDVPPNSTFWLYIERMYLHQAIQGYPCGAPGEPCPGTYFRPASTITRGQIAKIVSISAGYDDTIPPQQQTFSDVPPSSTFWLYIERVALHNVINGYSDGTYRPQNTVTRGQIAKIAANAFFPTCDTP